MTGPTTRITRLVGLARSGEEQARHHVGAARSATRRAEDDVTATVGAIGAVAGADLRFVGAVQAAGRRHLVEAEGRALHAHQELEAELAAWHLAHHRLEALERLDDRLRQELAAGRRRQEQLETDDLAGARRRRR